MIYELTIALIVENFCHQMLTFSVNFQVGDSGMLRYAPLITTDGTLHFEPFRGEHGRSNVLIRVSDNGENANDSNGNDGNGVSRVYAVSIVVLPLPRLVSVTPALVATHGNQRITVRGSFLSPFELPTATPPATPAVPGLPGEEKQLNCTKAARNLSSYDPSYYSYYWHDWQRLKVSKAAV